MMTIKEVQIYDIAINDIFCFEDRVGFFEYVGAGRFKKVEKKCKE